MKIVNSLELEQLKKRFIHLRKFAAGTKARTGWIYLTRQALMLSLAQLAKLAKLSTATVQQMELREQKKTITLESMHKLADAMNCEFVYAFVLKQELGTFLKSKALEKASRVVQNADVHMTLEDQRVKGNLKSRINRIADELLAKGDIW